MTSVFLKVFVVLTAIYQVSSSLHLPDCLNPTACDGALASCTVGIGCLGSPITMCSLGNFGYNGACQTFPNSTQNYCKCDSCVGLVNEIVYYTCTCGSTEYTCDPGFNLHVCESNLGAGTQYVCCKNGC